jgi:hypothetical protein
MRKNRKPEPTDHQLVELLCDWGIPPNDYRLDMMRAFLFHRCGFQVSMVMTYLVRLGYVSDPVRLAWEIRPFLHRKLIRPIKGSFWNGRFVQPYVVAKPRIHNPVYLPLFKKQEATQRKVGTRPRRQTHASMVPYSHTPISIIHRVFREHC